MPNNIAAGVSCPTDKANSRIAPCAPQRAPILRKIRVPLTGTNSSITDTDIDAAGGMAEFLAARFNDDTRSTRWHFSPELTDVEANVTEAAFGTSGSGAMFLAKRETMLQTFSMLGATLCNLKQFNELFHNKQAAYGTLDWLANGYLEGQLSRSTTVPNSYIIVAKKSQMIDVPMLTESTYTDPATVRVMFNQLRPKEDQMNTASLNLNSLGIDNLFEQAGVNTAVLQLGAAPTVTGMFTFYANGACGQNLGLAEYYGGVLDAGVFKATNATTGANMPIALVSVNQTTGLITLTLTTPPATLTPVLISMQAPSAVFSILGARYEVVTPLRVLNF